MLDQSNQRAPSLFESTLAQSRSELGFELLPRVPRRLRARQAARRQGDAANPRIGALHRLQVARARKLAHSLGDGLLRHTEQLGELGDAARTAEQVLDQVAV